MYSYDFKITDLEPELKTLYFLWKSASHDEFPRFSDFGLPNTGNAPNVLSLFEIERSELGSPVDFKALYARSRIRKTLNHKYVGTRLSDHPGRGEGSMIWSAFCKVAKDPRPLWVSLPYVGPLQRYRSTSEIYLPLLGDGARVDYLLIGVVLLVGDYGSKVVG